MQYRTTHSTTLCAGESRIGLWIGLADAQMCLLVQAETTQAMENLDGIASVPGVDGVFFGPADLSASMGFRGQSEHPAVRQAILAGIRRVRAAGRAAGVLMADPAVASIYLDAGAQFVAVGVDTSLLARAGRELVQRFKNMPAVGSVSAGDAYGAAS